MRLNKTKITYWLIQFQYGFFPFFFWGGGGVVVDEHCTAYDNLSTQPGIEAGPQQWKRRALTTGPSRNSHQHGLLLSTDKNLTYQAMEIILRDNLS